MLVLEQKTPDLHWKTHQPFRFGSTAPNLEQQQSTKEEHTEENNNPTQGKTTIPQEERERRKKSPLSNKTRPHKISTHPISKVHLVKLWLASQNVFIYIKTLNSQDKLFIWMIAIGFSEKVIKLLHVFPLYYWIPPYASTSKSFHHVIVSYTLD